MSLTLISFSSCTSCQSVRWIKNCTQDTLLIELAASDTLDDWLYWGENPEDTLGIMAPDTFAIYIHGDKIIIKNDYYALPDSLIRADGYVLTLKEPYYYIYAIKWQDVKHYPLEEIRARKLYDRQIVTKKDFHNRLFEYKPTGSKGDH
ncbi:MAG: hypothetical protein J5996_02065 [Prevotella sp.]|nr:hypothetical protein [Prevotella sp.]